MTYQQNLCSLQAKPLEKATFGYDFRETSSSSHEQVVKKVKKSDVSATFDHQGEQAVLLGTCLLRSYLYVHCTLLVH